MTPSFQAFTGTPQFLQGNDIPTSNENVNLDAFNQGILIFFYDRINQNIYWLNKVDANTGQVWLLFPGSTDNMGYIAVLPILGNNLYWFVSQTDNPTSDVPLPATLFDGTYGMLWWNRSSGAMYKLTAYTDNGNGTFNQTWTQIV